MANKERKLPSKKVAIIFTIVYLITQLIFLITVVGNMPLLVDTIDFTNYRGLATAFNNYYIYFDIAAGVIQIVQALLLARFFTNNGWPALITFITIIANIIICLAASSGLYIIDLRNIYYTIQITFAIPIVLIFLSCVFLIDDTVDLVNGKFKIHVSKATASAQRKFQQQQARIQNRGALKAAENPNEDLVLVSQEESLQQHHQVIANAAEMAIPDLGDKITADDETGGSDKLFNY